MIVEGKVREALCTGITLGIPRIATFKPTGIYRISADPLCEQYSHVSPPSQFMLITPVPGAPAPRSPWALSPGCLQTVLISARLH